MKIRSVFLTLLLFVSAASAHEFWLQPQDYRPDSTKAVVDVKVGMKFEGKTWGGDMKDVHEVQYYFGDQLKTLAAAGSLKKPVLNLEAMQPGQYLLGFTNESSFIKLDAKAFEKYVLSEGLDYVVEERKKLGESKKDGTELYRRCAKTLIQRGEGEPRSYDKNFGLPLELTALNDPYSANARLQNFQLTYQQKPLANAQIVIWHKDKGKVNRRELRSGKDGKIAFPLRQSGTWMLSVVHMVRLDSTQKADWQSYWGSYTFGF